MVFITCWIIYFFIDSEFSSAYSSIELQNTVLPLQSFQKSNDFIKSLFLPDIEQKPASFSVNSQALMAVSNEQENDNQINPSSEYPYRRMDPVPGKIEDPTGMAMQYFYSSLLDTELNREGAITRILHYGDSMIASDYISGQARVLFQEQFGDSGHGIMLLAKPWWEYHHFNVYFDPGGWYMAPVTNFDRRQSQYGIGCAIAYPGYIGSSSIYGTTDEEIGHSISKIEIYFKRQPDGGNIEVILDNAISIPFSTDYQQNINQWIPINDTIKFKVVTSLHPQEEDHSELAMMLGDENSLPADNTANQTPRNTPPHSAKAIITFPDGPHTFRVKYTGGGNVSLYGVVMERENPGVVYDTIGLLGARAQILKEMDADHWREQIELRDADLILINFGMNETADGDPYTNGYEEKLRQSLSILKEAAGNRSTLFMGPQDRGLRRGMGIITHPSIPKIIELQRKICYEFEIAYYDQYQAMGGEGTMGEWISEYPRLVSGDLIHPTEEGSQKLAELFYNAILEDYGLWKEQQNSFHSP